MPDFLMTTCNTITTFLYIVIVHTNFLMSHQSKKDFKKLTMNQTFFMGLKSKGHFIELLTEFGNQSFTPFTPSIISSSIYLDPLTDKAPWHMLKMCKIFF